jgi:hypothetical protein
VENLLRATDMLGLVLAQAARAQLDGKAAEGGSRHPARGDQRAQQESGADEDQQRAIRKFKAQTHGAPPSPVAAGSQWQQMIRNDRLLGALRQAEDRSRPFPVASGACRLALRPSPAPGGFLFRSCNGGNPDRQACCSALRHCHAYQVMAAVAAISIVWKKV